MILLTLVSLGSLGLATITPPNDDASAVVADAPDVVIILTDDQRLGLLDVMPVVRRTIIDKGVKFTQAMVPTSLCCPSRASILTGLYSHNTGVWHNGDKTAISGVPGGNEAFVAAGNEDRTLAVALDQAGYETVLIGKYLYGYGPPMAPPPGWDRFLAFGLDAYYYNYTLGGRQYGSSARDYSTDVIARRAVNIIETTPAGEPLFMYLAPKAPHHPYLPAPRDVDTPVSQYLHKSDFGALNEPDLSDKPQWLQPKAPVSAKRMHTTARDQHRTLLAVDDLVADVVAALRARGTLENTLLIFMSDNGVQWGEHRLSKKDLPYSASTRIPMAMRWDTHLAPATVRSDLALNIDIAPTVAQAAGVEMPGVDGVSLLTPVARTGFPLEGTIGKPLDDAGTVQRPAFCGWRTKTKLFVHYNDGSEELYLLDADPFEEHNQAKNPEYDGILTDLRAHALEQCVPTPPVFNW